MNRNHFAAEDIKDKLSALSSEKSSLVTLWEERRILYEQCMDLQLFYRDTEQADTWMAKQEVCNHTIRHKILKRRNIISLISMYSEFQSKFKFN